VLTFAHHACPRPGPPRPAAAVQEELFQERLRRASDASKRCTGLVGAGGDVVGEDPPSEADVAAVLAARAAAEVVHARAGEDAASHVLQAELSATGATHEVGCSSGSGGVGGAGASPGSGSPEGAETGGGSGGGGYSGLEGFSPQWVLLESNQWRKRVQAWPWAAGARGGRLGLFSHCCLHARPPLPRTRRLPPAGLRHPRRSCSALWRRCGW
jgi:hypothetical protein